MIIDRNLSTYIVFCEDSILEGLRKISANDARIVFSVTEKGVLEGVLTNGDFRRWMNAYPNFDVSSQIGLITNKQCKSAQITDSPEDIERLMGGHTCLPLLDQNKHLVAFARRPRSTEIRVGQHVVSDQAPAFTIAEIGINHNGSLELAKRLVEAAASSGADCAKFQMRDMDSLYRKAPSSEASAEDLGAQYALSLLERFQLSNEEMFEVFDYCKQHNILPLCTAWDLRSLDALESYGMEAYKVASADLTNHDLIIPLARTGKPLFCSTGMATEAEIIETVELLKHHGAPYVLLHCNSTYPAPFKDVNLRYLDRLGEIGRCPVGYSGHERGISVALAAVARGAKVIEKHLTLDKNMEGSDHKVSLLPEEFAAMVQGIRQIEAAVGNAEPRRITQGEMMNRNTLAKSLIASCEIQSGQEITLEMIEVKSPGRGLQPNRKQALVGVRSRRHMRAGDFFFASDLGEGVVIARNYSFRRKWGVSVRYHDLARILSKSNPDFLEFHFSFKDLDEDFRAYLPEPLDMDLVVHSPDLFAGDHLLNLCTEDSEYRNRSIRELQRVIDITRNLRARFSKTDAKTKVIVSLGGFSKDAPLNPAQVSLQYEIAAESLSKLSQDEVEILPQTLPPFPWYFGGQLFANLFVYADDTSAFCSETGYRLCFDVCHSKLTCNHEKSDFSEFVERVGPHTAHLHIADASGVDGEGLQINEGDIDFRGLASALDRLAPEASFIPEIWQGHKNDGEGFWLAAERLEGRF